LSLYLVKLHTRGSFPGGVKAARFWSWPLTSI